MAEMRRLAAHASDGIVRFLLSPFPSAIARRFLGFARRFLGAVLRWGLFFFGASAAAAVVFLYFFPSTPQDVAYRALDPNSPACSSEPDIRDARDIWDIPDGWSILAQDAVGDDGLLHPIGNDEQLAIKRGLQFGNFGWDTRFHCSIQTHSVPGYQPKDLDDRPTGGVRALSYDLAFLEFQENGDPYILCSQEWYESGSCDGVKIPKDIPKSGAAPPGQLEAIIARLEHTKKNFVVVFVHGWRHNADIGDGNVQDLRVYAAHAARFVADRCSWGDARFCDMKTTAIYVGWRGARKDELRVQSLLSPIGEAICRILPASGSHRQVVDGKDPPCFVRDLLSYVGTAGAAFTLFDRKPISEAIAPSVLTALQGVENAIGLRGAQRSADLAPCEFRDMKADDCDAKAGGGGARQARMIVFGHSLGGNLLITALEDEIVKFVSVHRPFRTAGDHDEPADYLPSPLGNLVVLINSAAEAAKWTAIQRSVWRRIIMSDADKGHADDYVLGHEFFRDDQRPVLLSVTAARDWPPGGLHRADCIEIIRQLDQFKESPKSIAFRQAMRAELDRRSSVDYDWATYDMFPTFRFDFRPIANSLKIYVERPPPHLHQMNGNVCTELILADRPKGWWSRRIEKFAGALQVFPFMNTDIESTHAIGHLDPPRPPRSDIRVLAFSGRPFGTTHELQGWDSSASADRRSPQEKDAYKETVSDQRCPVMSGWLSRVKEAKRGDPGSGGHATFWDANLLPQNERPALRFTHGFELAGIAAITRANDPFWNMRALDTALASHDGYMLSSFICAMDQLVLDDVTAIAPQVKAPIIWP
jgi:hypothetical protein